MVRFFVVGDIGEPGQWRSAVADAMSVMQNDGLGATFVLTTGDNSYKSAGFNDDSFTTLKQARDDIQGTASMVPMSW